MKKTEVVNLFNLFDLIKAKESNIKFSYAVVKNKKIIQTEIESIEEIQKEKEKILEGYLTERDELIKKFGKTNEKGLPEIKAEDKQAMANFTSEDIILREKYKNELEEYTLKQKEFDEILEEEVEFNFHKMKIDIMPDFITPQMLEFLMEIGIVESD